MPIFHLEDIKKYPGITFDTKTNNKTFLRFAGLLKYMGVENHYFHLALLNPELAGVDPHDPNLSPRMKLLVAAEARDNIWYRMRECFKAPAKAGAKASDFIANRSTIARIWLFHQHITTFTEQPRQSGKTHLARQIIADLMNFGLKDTSLSHLTVGNKLLLETIEAIKSILDTLPPYLKRTSKHDRNNRESIYLAKPNVDLKTLVGQASVKLADEAGRGLTTAVQDNDEVAYIKNLETILAASLPGSGAVVEIAKSVGAPYGIMYTTTAGDLDDRDGAYAYSLLTGSMRWNETMFDIGSTDKLIRMLTKNSSNRIISIINNHRQLGLTDEWLADMKVKTNSKGKKFEKDYLGVWTHGSSTSIFSDETIKKLEASKVMDYEIEVTKFDYIIRWFANSRDRTVMMREPTILGLDTSGATGSDDIFMSCGTIASNETIFAGNYNETNTLKFSRFIVMLLVKYPKMTLVIENKYNGQSIIDNIIDMLVEKGINPFKRLFNWVVEDQVKYPNRFEEINKSFMDIDLTVFEKYRDKFGFTTTGGEGRQSRSLLYEAIHNVLEISGAVIKDPIIITQIRTLQEKNNRIDHGPKNHDDGVISILLRHWFLTKVRHTNYYGIKALDKMVIQRAFDSLLDTQEEKQREEFVRIKAEIVEYMRIINSGDSTSSAKFLAKKRLMRTVNNIDDDMSSIVNVEELKLLNKLLKSKETVGLDIKTVSKY